MPTVDTNSPVEVEVNVTTEAPTIDVQIDGYLRSEMFVVDIAYRLTRPTDIYDPGTYRWEFSATSNEIADAVTRGKKIVGHRVTSSTGGLILNGYAECLFDGIGGINTISATFKEITSTGITYYTVSGASKIATVETVPFSSGDSGISSLLVTFSWSNGVWTADKTFAEVTAAIADGAYVYATDGGAFYTLTECDPRPNDGAVKFISAGAPIFGFTLWHDEDVDSISISVASVTWVQNGYQAKAITDTGGYYTTDTVEGALQEIGASKLDKAQGVANAGKFLVVGSDGNITAVTMTAWSGGSY